MDLSAGTWVWEVLWFLPSLFLNPWLSNTWTGTHIRFLLFCSRYLLFLFNTDSQTGFALTALFTVFIFQVSSFENFFSKKELMILLNMRIYQVQGLILYNNSYSGLPLDGNKCHCCKTDNEALNKSTVFLLILVVVQLCGFLKDCRCRFVTFFSKKWIICDKRAASVNLEMFFYFLYFAWTGKVMLCLWGVDPPHVAVLRSCSSPYWSLYDYLMTTLTLRFMRKSVPTKEGLIMFHRIILSSNFSQSHTLRKHD